MGGGQGHCVAHEAQISNSPPAHKEFPGQMPTVPALRKPQVARGVLSILGCWTSLRTGVQETPAGIPIPQAGP